MERHTGPTDSPEQTIHSFRRDKQRRQPHRPRQHSGWLGQTLRTSINEILRQKMGRSKTHHKTTNRFRLPPLQTVQAIDAELVLRSYRARSTAHPHTSSTNKPRDIRRPMVLHHRQSQHLQRRQNLAGSKLYLRISLENRPTNSDAKTKTKDKEDSQNLPIPTYVSDYRWNKRQIHGQEHKTTTPRKQHNRCNGKSTTAVANLFHYDVTGTDSRRRRRRNSTLGKLQPGNGDTPGCRQNFRSLRVAYKSKTKQISDTLREKTPRGFLYQGNKNIIES